VFFFVYFLLLVLNLFVSTIATVCLKRLVSEMTCMSSDQVTRVTETDSSKNFTSLLATLPYATANVGVMHSVCIALLAYFSHCLTLYRMVMPIGTPFLKEKINN